MKLFLSFGVSIMLFLPMCSISNDKLPNGIFYYIGGNGNLIKLDFKENTVQRINVVEKGILSPYSLAKINEEELLFVNQKRDGKIFNIRTKEIRQWDTKIGINPIYFSKYNVIISSGIVVRDFNNPMKKEKIAYNFKNIAHGSGDYLKISEDELFYSHLSRGRWIYNLETKKVKKVSDVSCEKAIYRKETNELLCKDYKEKVFYLNSLDGTNRKEISEIDNGFKPELYLEDLDAVIGTKSSIQFFPLKERWDCWIYYFKENKFTRLKKGCMTTGIVRFMN